MDLEGFSWILVGFGHEMGTKGHRSGGKGKGRGTIGGRDWVRR